MRIGDRIGPGFEDGGIHLPRVNGAETDTVGLLLHRRGGDEPMQGEFGGHIRRATQRVAALASDGVDHHHQATMALAHAGQHGLERVKGRIEIVVEHRLPTGGVQFGQRPFLDIGAGVGHQQVDGSQEGSRLGGDTGRVGGLRAIARHGMGPAAMVQGRQGRGEFVGVAPGDDHAGTLLQQQAGGCQANAAAAASDEGAQAGQGVGGGGARHGSGSAGWVGSGLGPWHAF